MAYPADPTLVTPSNNYLLQVQLSFRSRTQCKDFVWFSERFSLVILKDLFGDSINQTPDRCQVTATPQLIIVCLRDCLIHEWLFKAAISHGTVAKWFLV